MIRPMIEPVCRWFAVCLLLGGMTPSPVSALPSGPRRAAAPAAVDDAPEGAADEAGSDAGEDDAGRADAPDGAPKRRPGVRQFEKEKPADDRLEDPEAARRAQWFGALPGFPIQGMPFPIVPQPGFPVVPPGGGGAVAGAAAGNAPGFGFRATTVVVGGAGNAMPGGNGFVVHTWVVGPDGQVIQQPPAGPEGKPGADQPQGGRRGAKPPRQAEGKKDAAKKVPAPRTRKGPRVPRDEAGGE